MTCPMNCLIGKDFIWDGGRPPDFPTMMGSYGVSIIISAAHKMAEWNHINANYAVIKEERGKTQKHLAEHGLQSPLLPLRVRQALRICFSIIRLCCWQGQEVNEEKLQPRFWGSRLDAVSARRSLRGCQIDGSLTFHTWRRSGSPSSTTSPHPCLSSSFRDPIMEQDGKGRKNRGTLHMGRLY